MADEIDPKQEQATETSDGGANRRDLLRNGAGLFALAAALTGAESASAQTKPKAKARPRQAKPNIIMMLVDNMGYGDLSCYAGPIRGQNTPRLDRMAAEGLRLTNFNTEPECTPSRSAFLTGRMPIRSGTSTVMVAGSRDGLPPWEYTLAELLSDAGYATACYGKWHLGTADGRHPNDQGFDEWYGIPRSSGETAWPLQVGFDPEVYKDQPVMEGRKGERSKALQPYDIKMRPLIDREVTRRAADFIQRKAKGDKPFFLYVPFTLPHVPPLAHPDFVKPGRGPYQNVLAEIDHNVGVVLDTVTKAGIDEDTIIIFASDNGPQTLQGVGVDFGAQADTGPFRIEFPSAWEGAIRTPCIVRWPGQIEPGRESNEIVSLLDFYRTFANIAGAGERVPTDRAIDSLDMTDFLFRNKESSGREHVMYFYRDDLLAIKWRGFKMHFTLRLPASGAVVFPGQNVALGVETEVIYPWTFNIESDPKELWNVGNMSGWLRGGPIARIRREYEESVTRFPNIKPGAERP